MAKDPAKTSAGGVEEIISELHERGVRGGQEESERIVAQARLRAGEILKESEAERARIIEDARREAERIHDAAALEAQQMLESFMASLPDLFSRRASELLDAVLDNAFDANRDSDTISRFVATLDSDTNTAVRDLFAKADAQSFIEGLLVMAVAFYANARGFDHFTLDENLRKTWARLTGDPASAPAVSYEFREGISGFSVSGKDGREVVVSPESIKHMAQAWAGEEFRDIYVNLRTTTEATE